MENRKTTTLTVEINIKDAESTMLAISMIKGVKNVFADEDDIYTHKDHKAWILALEDFKKGDYYTLEELEKSLARSMKRYEKRAAQKRERIFEEVFFGAG